MYFLNLFSNTTKFYKGLFNINKLISILYHIHFLGYAIALNCFTLQGIESDSFIIDIVL
jgi:hypothetical protein